MKKVIHHYILIAAVLYIIAGTVAIGYVSMWITNQYFGTMGANAMNLAIEASNAIEVTDDQFDMLKEIPFHQLIETESNQELSKIFQKNPLSDHVKYAYVVFHLDENTSPYYVESVDADFYQKPVGTPLEWIWILDVIVNKEEREKALGDPSYYADKKRYTNFDEKFAELKRLYADQESGYFISSDEWGNQISGMTPVYTTEGTYMGLLGVDLYSTEFYAFRNKVIFVLALLIFIPTVIISILYFSFHFQYRKEMKNIVFLDKVTGLFTRAYYEDYARKQAKTLIRAEDSLTAIMIDIDEFKAYNDYYGHTKGDEVIKAIGEIIRSEAERVDGCPGRYGGEEFIVFVPNLSIEEGDCLCESIRTKVEEKNFVHEIRQDIMIVTVSMGIYSSGPKDLPIDPHQLIEKADQALYIAKRAGKNCIQRFQ